MYKKHIKRWLDFLLALMVMPFVLLLIIIMAPFIYLSDPGPVFYNGKRRGKDGVPFKMFKFRSMYVNSPDIRNSDGSTFNGDRDPRVTKIGRFMRKTSIDEMPQLLNVLLGDMSFVGPRPTLATKPFDEVEEERKRRYDVRPGITGYAQAYYRNSISQEDKFKYDLYYVDHISFVLDMKILFKTVMSVLMRENIYVSRENAVGHGGNEKETIHK
ncbi:sugar transferase [Enterocloster citroniae]|uniref:sugar transferase n=1 Tax=Enterocloster citroniae TaxID=358743 RepID=UPI0008EB04B2|nr:sugar transferase [Enterocloster citroniae]SFR92375.1 Sugar transferase involved in LPS biosynthesis (colanic, teichoic acid) [Enterocloster citroniae]